MMAYVLRFHSHAVSFEDLLLGWCNSLLAACFVEFVQAASFLVPQDIARHGRRPPCGQNLRPSSTQTGPDGLVCRMSIDLIAWLALPHTMDPLPQAPQT